MSEYSSPRPNPKIKIGKLRPKAEGRKFELESIGEGKFVPKRKPVDLEQRN